MMKCASAIKADSGKHFDPVVVEAFMDLKDLSV